MEKTELCIHIDLGMDKVPVGRLVVRELAQLYGYMMAVLADHEGLITWIKGTVYFSKIIPLMCHQSEHIDYLI